MGTLSVTELFEVLVDDHGMRVKEAVTALVVEMDRAGYPPEATTVSAEDGLDIVQAVLHQG